MKKKLETSKLQALTVKELHKISDELGLEESSGLRKQDLIKLILEKQNGEKYFPIKYLEVKKR